MATMNISLPEQMKLWVEEHVRSGNYANASDYVRDLIRRDNARRQALHQALVDGENSGPSQPFDSESFKKRMREKHVR